VLWCLRPTHPDHFIAGRHTQQRFGSGVNRITKAGRSNLAGDSLARPVPAAVRLPRARRHRHLVPDHDAGTVAGRLFGARVFAVSTVAVAPARSSRRSSLESHRRVPAGARSRSRAGPTTGGSVRPAGWRDLAQLGVAVKPKQIEARWAKARKRFSQQQVFSIIPSVCPRLSGKAISPFDWFQFP
jgi:hypothetical protein